MSDRLVIIPMTNRIRNTPIATPHIVREIVKSGGLTVLLNRALEGLRRLRSQGTFTVPHRVISLTKAYIEDNNQAAQFIRDVENGEVDHGYTFSSHCDGLDSKCLKSIDAVRAKVLYAIYAQWARENNCRALSKLNFGKEMKRLGYTNEYKKRLDEKTPNPVTVWQRIR